MKAKLLDDHDGHRVFAVVLEEGEEFVAGMTSFAREYHVGGSQITATGGFHDASLGYLDRKSTTLQEIRVDEQVEVLSLNGTITRSGDVTHDGLEPNVSAHVVLGRSNGSTLGGRLLSGAVWPALEVVVTESPKYLHRRTDERTGLALIEISPAEEASSPQGSA